METRSLLDSDLAKTERASKTSALAIQIRHYLNASVGGCLGPPSCQITSKDRADVSSRDGVQPGQGDNELSADNEQVFKTE
jgi:hypothetical protein